MSPLLNSTFLSALVFLFVAVGVWYMSSSYSEMGRLVPQVAAAALAVFSVIQLVVAVVQRKEERPFAGVVVKRLLVLAAGTVAYIVLILYLGFLFASFLFLMFFFWFLSLGQEERPGVLRMLLLAVGISLGFFLLFNNVFLVPLPQGLWFGG